MSKNGISVFCVAFLLGVIPMVTGTESEGLITEVVVISSLHAAHKGHPFYDYETLYALIESYNPDYVGVEIRPEDMHSDQAYLSKNYPKEMVKIAQGYKEKSFGFDWLGEEIEGVPIPENYWKNMKYKKLLNDMDRDEQFLTRMPEEIAKLQAQQSDLISKATPSLLNNGRYGDLARKIDQLQIKWYRGTQYEYLAWFNAQRDKHIGQNINSFIEQHSKKRIVLVMGADHRTYAVENIEKRFKTEVRFLPVVDPKNKRQDK